MRCIELDVEGSQRSNTYVCRRLMGLSLRRIPAGNGPLREEAPHILLSLPILALFCLLITTSSGRAADWPEWLGRNRDGIWHEDGLIEKFPAGGPKVRWRVPIGNGYSGPAVAGGLVYVMDRQRATDPAGKPVRATREGIPGNERTLCLNARDGKLVWKDEYQCHYRVSYSEGPRTTPLVRAGRVYTLGTMGDLRCLDASTGSRYWTKNLMEGYKLDKPPAWGFAAHPLLDGDLLYCLVGGAGSAVVAIHKDSGKEAWRALTTEEVCYSPPMVYEAGGKRQLIVWLSDSINSLDPATGRIYWTLPYPTVGKPTHPAANIATVRRAGDLLFFTGPYHGSHMLQLAADKPGATLKWKHENNNSTRLEHLSSLIPTPVIQAGHIYGVSFMGELCCLEAETGKQLWETSALFGGKKTDCGTAFLVPQGERYIIFNDLGDLILAELSSKGYKEIDRARIVEPVQESRHRHVVWSHPAFAERCVFARNGKEIVCVSLAREKAELK
jgi:outer membrane protein assembly factor BamB